MTTDVVGGRYRLSQLLGRGGMSDVYAAVDLRDHSPVAVKIVRSGDPELARRLAQEARALEGFDHPGLVRLLDTGVFDEQAYLVMELVDGSTLADALQQGRLGPERTAAVGAALAGARLLAYVHERGIVHRDLKPANVLLTRDGQVRLADFGIARLVDASTLTMAGTTLGTASYMAPEQLEDHQVGPSADVWSLGIVLLECLTGRRVYEGTPSEVVARRLTAPVPLPSDLPAPWTLILSGMLDHRPDQRLGAGEVATLLATSVFEAPWLPAASPVAGHPTLVGHPTLAGHPTLGVDHDLTSLLPPVPPSTEAARPPHDTIVTPAGPAASPARRSVGPWQLGLAAVLAGALVVGLVVWLGAGAPRRGPATAGSSAPTSAPSTTPPSTTSTTPPTTAAPLSGPVALGALVRVVASDEASGVLDVGVGQSIANPAQQAVADESAGRPSQAINDLQQAAMAIANGIEAGSITQPVGAELQADLATLADALGMSAASTPPPTQPARPAGPAGKGSGRDPLGKDH